MLVKSKNYSYEKFIIYRDDNPVYFQVCRYKNECLNCEKEKQKSKERNEKAIDCSLISIILSTGHQEYYKHGLIDRVVEI